MRILLPALIAASIAAPAVAQPVPATQLSAGIADGRTVDQLGNMVGALTKALLQIPVGEVEAAIENRPMTRADRNKTVGTVTGTDERELDREVRSGTVAVKQGGEAMARALPVVVEALNKAGDDVARVINNLPSPNYPHR